MRNIVRAFRDLAPLMPTRARRFFRVYIVLSSLLSLLDIAALSLLAVSLGAIAVGAPVELPLFGEIGQDGYVWILVAVSGLIIVKSTLAVGLQWAATRRFATFELEIGDRLFDAYIRAPWTERIGRSTAELVRIADIGIANAVGGFLLPILSLPSLIVTFTAIVLVLVVAQPLTALVTILYLGGIAALMALWLSRKALQAGRVNRDFSIKVARLMTEMMGALKEVTLRNKAEEVATIVHDNRIHATRARSNLSFLSVVPRFVLDAALVGGFLLVGGVAYLAGGLAQAFAAVALFGVAGVRLVPSLTTFQGVINQGVSAVPNVYSVVSDINASDYQRQNAEHLGTGALPESPEMLSLRGVEFSYPGSDRPALHSIDLDIPFGKTLALVGASGAGKSSLVDVLLGLLVPSAGTISIDGQRLTEVLGSWRSRVGYVPQEVSLFDGSVAQNVALAWGDDLIDFAKVESVLRRAQVWDVVAERPDGIHSRIGERGLALSGGQRQRLGIARALYSDPLVLIMDEATSALDTKTESDVAMAIRELRGQLTIISVAHRLATVRDNDQVCFMRNGTIAASGTFQQVVAEMPEFAEQAALAGLA